MRYQITGKQIDIGEALQTHVKSELGETVEKYAQRPTDAAVIFSRVGHEYFCEATIHLSTGLTAAAIDADEANPGPILLQSARGPVAFRNIILTTLVKK